MLDAMETIIDDPIEPLRDFSAYLVAVYGAENARVMMATWAAAARGILERGGGIARDRALEVTCPVLLIVGDQDPVLPVTIVEELAGSLPRGEVRVAAGAGHSVHDDRAEWLESIVLEFLERAGRAPRI